MSTRTIVKATDARGFLSLVPKLLGFMPAESIVIVPFAGGRSLGAMRLDLPDAADPDMHQIAATIVGMACRVDAADGIAVVVYTVHQAADVEHVLAAIGTRAEECGLRIVDSLYVAGDGWGSSIEGAEPRPLDELAPPDEVAHLSVAPDQHAPALPVLDEALMLAARSALVTFEPEYLSDPIELNEVLLTMDLDELAGEMIGYLSYVLERPALRDIFLVQAAGGQAMGEQAVDAQLGWENEGQYPPHIARHMWGEGARPDPERLTRALELARITASVTGLPGALSLAAWCSWALGRSTHAEDYARQGLAVEPEHVLCGIVQTFVTAGHLPDWAFHRTV